MEVVTVLFVVAIIFGATDGKITPRIAGGIPVDTLTKFGHHVTIHPRIDSEEAGFCSGSVITDQWILTTANCVSRASRLRLDFNRMYLNSSQDSFSVIVDNSGVVTYPTGYDDIALVKIPLKLVLSSKIRAVPLYQSVDVGSNFAVMPGFSTEDGIDRLTYGMFQIVPKGMCESAYGSDFDRYLEMCTLGWNNNRNVPCKGNEGGALLTGWPRKSEVIGVFSKSRNCSAQYPAVYTEISKYIPWINSVIGISPGSDTDYPV